MSAAQFFERVPLRASPSNLPARGYGSAQPPTNERSGVTVGNVSKPPIVELRRFSSTSALPIELAVSGENNSRVRSGSVDEFNGVEVLPEVKMSNITKAVRTGRQRKKTAARTKGGEFQARRKKRRVYFCCISNDIDVEKLVDEFQVPHFGMTGQLYDEVLHLTIAKAGDENKMNTDSATETLPMDLRDLTRRDSGVSTESAPATLNPLQGPSPHGSGFFSVRQPVQLLRHTHPSFEVSYKEDTLLNDFDADGGRPVYVRHHPREGDNLSYLASFEEDGYPSANEGESSPRGHFEGERGVIDRGLSAPLVDGTQAPAGDPPGGVVSDTEHSKEVFVFGFGVAVFWGLAKSDVQDLLQFIAQYIVKDRLSTEEFEAGEDDMAFVTDYDSASVHIANDVVTLPALTTVKERLAISFAIAQSAVLTIFEARVEKKIEEYKYIPVTLAACGKVDLSTKQLGTMIGEVFVMQHDVNLHSEILDLPDYFWKEHQVEPLYRMTMDYMEMAPRISVLNKRLDLMRQLLHVLQQQHENAHSVKLEWIVIWLIVISCVLEAWDIVKDVLGLHAGPA